MPSLSVTIIVASLGRPDALAELLIDLNGQTYPPSQIILSVTSTDDLPWNITDYHNVCAVLSRKGSCAQRNAALRQLQEPSDIVAFLDDDYVPSRFAIERMVRLFENNPDLAGATGDLLADGVNGPGISIEDARALLAEYDRALDPLAIPSHDLRGLYGCNMVFRRTMMGDAQFDERLPLYGWQEDIDFASQISARGRTVKTFAFAGVHRGVKKGRSSGVRLGFSQVVNPAYLVRKGTMQPRYAAKIVVRNVLANHARAFRPEPWIDRLGRVRGNWIGIFDLIRGKIAPWRVEQL